VNLQDLDNVDYHLARLADVKIDRTHTRVGNDESETDHEALEAGKTDIRLGDRMYLAINSRGHVEQYLRMDYNGMSVKSS
jgi:hypothetical protein